MSYIEVVSDSSTKANLTMAAGDASNALESGKVLFFPKLAFDILPSEQRIFNPNIVSKKRKNISYDCRSNRISGLSADAETRLQLKQLMQRYLKFSLQLLNSVVPHYSSALINGRTSYRPIEIDGRHARSYRKDDTRLHVDAFPSTPMNDKRIIRVFTNINPNDKTRNWRIGEDFEHVAKRFSHELSNPFPGVRRLKQWFKISKSYQSLYDHFMVRIHNRMKQDLQYQNTVAQEVFEFPASSTWIVCTDRVSHAVDSGQYVLEQTFYLPKDCMVDPSKSPQNILSYYLGFNKK